MNQPHLTPNTRFFSIEELKQVRGFEGKKYQLIAPYVSALPAETKININTAPALVLASMDEKLDLNAVTDALQRKQSSMEYFNATGDLWGLEPFDQISATNKAQVNPLLDIKSDFFKAEIEVRLSERKRQFTTYFKRDENQIYVYFRSLAPF